MKNITKYVLAFLIFNGAFSITNAQVAINEDDSEPDASAMLDVSSTDKGLLIPRMDSIARKNIAAPADGLLVYDNSTTTYWYYDNTKWNEIRNGTTAISYLDFVDSLPDDDLDLSCSTEVEELTLSRNISDAFIAGNFLYAISGTSVDSFYVFDLHDPLAPTLVADIAILLAPYEVIIAGQYAYIIHSETSNNFTVIDISDPLHPIEVSRISVGDRLETIDIVGDYAYVIDENGDLIFVNISDPTIPVAESTTNVIPNTSTPDLEIKNNYAYILNNDRFGKTLQVVDISNIANPINVDTLDLGSAPRELKVVDNYAYVIDFTDQELIIIDISDPSNLNIISNTSLGASPRELRIANGYAFIGTGNTTGGFKIVDISDPINPVIEGDLSVIEAAQSINIFGSYAYIPGNDSGLSIVFITPCNPLYVGVNGFSGELSAITENDNLGDHIATENIQLSNFYLSNDGDSEGIQIDDEGKVGIGLNPTDRLSVQLGGNGEEILDANNTDLTSSYDDPGDTWQSYTVLNAGILSRIELRFVDVSGTRTVRIYEGEGTSGNLLGTVTTDISGSGIYFASFDLYTNQIEQLAGEVYTIAIDDQYGLLLSINNPYDGGREKKTTDWDLSFKVYVEGIGSFNVGSEGVSINSYTFPWADGAANQLLATDGNGNLDWVDETTFTDTDDQTIDNLNLNGTILELSLEDDGQSDQTVDLASLDTDTDNQTIDNLNLNGTTLELSLEDDEQSDQTVDLAALQDDLGNHSATQNIALNDNFISNDGDNEGIQVDDEGKIGIGLSPTDRLSVQLGGGNGVEILDASNTNAPSLYDNSGDNWQSYTALNAGILSRVELEFNTASGNRTVSIYEGEGTSGNLLGTVTTDVTSSGIYFASFDLSTNQIEQLAGEVYTIAIDNKERLFLNLNNPYDGGRDRIGADRDLSFKVYVEDIGSFNIGSEGVSINNYTFPRTDGAANQLLATDGNGNLDWVDEPTFTDTDDQTIDKLNLNGKTLEISLEDDGQSDETVDLASLDTDEQTIDKLNLNGTTLEISLEGDGQSDQTVDLASIDTNTDDQSLSLNGKVLNIDGGTGVDLTALLVPIGTIQMWPTSSPPSGWLICNGSSFNASTYPELNSILGGNALPNFNGRFPLGVGNSGTSGSTNHSIKSVGGEETHVLTINEMPSHSHGVTYSDRSKDGSGNNVSDLGSSGQTKTTTSTGGGQAHNNMPPFYTINFIIKAE